MYSVLNGSVQSGMSLLLLYNICNQVLQSWSDNCGPVRLLLLLKLSQIIYCGVLDHAPASSIYSLFFEEFSNLTCMHSSSNTSDFLPKDIVRVS